MGLATAVIGGAVIGAVGSKKAGDAAAEGAQASANAAVTSSRIQVRESRRQYNQTRDDFAPWRDVGAAALDRIEAGVKDGTYDMSGWSFEADPGYEFRQREGQKYLDSSGAAGRTLLSGGQLKAALAYNQDLASNEYGAAYGRGRQERADRFNRDASLAGVGQQATGSTAAAGQQASNNIVSAIGQRGAAQGQAAMAAGQARADQYGNITGAANQGISNYLLLNQLGMT